MGLTFNPFTGTLDFTGTGGGGGGGTPGGPTTSVQYNDGGGNFGGDADLVWNKTTHVLTLTGTASIVVPNDSTAAQVWANANAPTITPQLFIGNTGAWSLFGDAFVGSIILSENDDHSLEGQNFLNLTAPVMSFAGDPGNTAVTIFGTQLVTQSTTSANTGAQTYESRVVQVYDATDGSPSLDGKNVFSADVQIGHSAAAVGSVLGVSSGIRVEGSGNALNETANYYALTDVNIGTGFAQTTGPTGKYWIWDTQLFGPIAVQPNGLNGLSVLFNNFYNGSPAQNNSNGMTLTTRKGVGNGDATHAAADTYPIDVGLQIVGVSDVSGVTGIGWTTAIQVGGTGGPWLPVASKIGTGIHVRDYATYGIKIDNPTVATAPDLSMAGFFEGFEMTAPAAGAANSYRIFAQDNGAGKTQLMVLFNTGVAQQLAVQA
jgi:hypothetical protein